MTDFSRPGTRPEQPGLAGKISNSRRRLGYSGNNSFQQALRLRADAYFRDTGHRRRDVAGWYCKAASILALAASSYLLLVFAAATWWQGALLAIALSLAVASIGFNIMHDGGHGAASRHRVINRLLAHTLDIVGGSSYLWRWKHGVLHHNYPNLTGHDADVSLGMLARFTPHQPRYAHQRWQHWYVWILYSLLAIKWQVYDDFKVLLTGRIGPHRIPRPRGADLLMLIGGKVAFFTLAFAIPLMMHSVLIFVPFYFLFATVLGIVLSTVFQLAHTVEEAAFPELPTDASSVSNSWAAHQVQTTVNFCRGNRIATFLLGGLNYQIEHHLFPEINHCHYPELSGIVKSTCGDFGIAYNEHATLLGGVGSHFRWLKRMGKLHESANSIAC